MPDANMIATSAEEAWALYAERIEQARKRIMCHPRACDKDSLSRALYVLQAAQVLAFNAYVAPRPSYPSFYVHPVVMPFENSLLLSNPDFIYHQAFLDGQRVYRIWGKLGTTRILDFQVASGNFGDEDSSTFSSLDFDDVKIAADGSFELVASANARVGQGCINLNPASRNNFLVVREVWNDWSAETPLTIHIDEVRSPSRPPQPIYHDLAEMERRLGLSARMVEREIELAITMSESVVKAAGANQVFNFSTLTSLAGSAQTAYFHIVADLKDGEALIVESNMPATSYWGIFLADTWNQTLDYSYHCTSLNAYSAFVGANGRLCAVVAPSDPGVANWLDTMGLGKLNVLLRWFKPVNAPQPIVRVVRAAEIERHVPADTPRISASDRAEQIRVRTRSSLRRYGY